jgi:CRISPR-associated RAMP protein (TIGR02581 family)
MFDTFKSRLVVEGYVVPESALRIGAGRAAEVSGTELPVMRDGRGRPYIPGSSFKGALRSYIETLLRGWCDSPFCACNPVDEKEQCIRPGPIQSRSPNWKYPANGSVPEKPVGIDDLRHGLQELRGKDPDLEFTRRVEANSCLVCQTFGSPWLASHVRVRDLPVVDGEWFGQFQVRDGVAIDRDKGTVSEGRLYDYEVVPAGTRFELQIVAENLEDWQMGLVWLGLRALERGDVALGGFTSRGLGWVRLEGRRVHLFEGAGDLLELLGGAEAGREVKDDEAKSWVEAFHAELKRKGAQDA